MSKTKSKAIDDKNQASIQPDQLPSVGAAAIKARDDQGGIILRWREHEGKVIADGLASEGGKIAKKEYQIEILEGGDRDGRIKESLAAMASCEHSHAYAVCASIPNIKDEAEHSIKMRTNAEDVKLLQGIEARAKSAHKVAKDELEQALDRLAELAGEDCVPPLFKDKPAEGKGKGSAPAATEAWCDVPLAELVAHGAPQAIITKLCGRSPSMDTLGKLSDYMNAKGQWWAKDLNCGIGPEKAQQIADAYSGWFFNNPEKGGGVQGAEAKPADAKPETVAQTEEPPEGEQSGENNQGDDMPPNE